MHNKAMVAIVVSASLVVSSCATPGQGPTHNQQTGAVMGALLGGLIGAAVSKDKGQGLVLGALAGGLIGAGIGSYLDEKEKRELAEASIRAAAHARKGERIAWGETTTIPPNSAQTAALPAPTKKSKKGKTSTQAVSNGSGWVTPASSVKTASADPNAASGWVIPVSDAYVNASGQTCRDLQQVANKGGKTYQQNVQACRTAQGWVVPQA